MHLCLVIPPKVEGQYVHREDKHVSMHTYPFVPYTAPLLYAIIQQELPDVRLSILEAQRDGLDNEAALQRLKEINPDIAVVLMGWITIPQDRILAETGIPTIGIIVQQWIDQMEATKLYNLTIPYVLFKEIEAPLIAALREFKEKGEVRDAPGVLVCHSPGDYRLNAPPEPSDPTRFPIPAYEAFDLERYFTQRSEAPNFPADKVRMAYMNTMKSCPFQCSFCGQSNDGTKVRYQTPEQIVDQLAFLHQTYGITRFEFIDNVFAIHKKRAKAFCKELIRRKLPIRYSINDRLGYYDCELIELLHQSGCFEVRVGIETCDPELQAYLNKPLDLEMAKREIHLIRSFGIEIYLYFTPGIPGETDESLKLNARFITDVHADTFTTGALFIMPSTPLYRTLKAEGKILIEEWSEYRKQNQMVYINESYPTMEAVREASTRLKKLVFRYRILQGLQEGWQGLSWAAANLWYLLDRLRPLKRFGRRVFQRLSNAWK